MKLGTRTEETVGYEAAQTKKQLRHMHGCFLPSGIDKKVPIGK